MSDLSCFTESTAVLKISHYFRRQIPTVPENMILFLLFERERRLFSHICQICLALLKVQHFWKYQAISGGKFPNANRKHDLIFIIWKSKKAFVPFKSYLSCFTESTAVLKISHYFRRQISYCFQKTWSYFYNFKEKEGFCPINVRFVLLYWKYSSFENITLFQEANILLFQKTWTYFYYLKEKEGFCPFYVRFVLLYWEHSSFENISLFQEANILLLAENMILFLLFERERRLLLHLCQICLALLKVQQFWKYHSISGGKYPNAHRKHDLIFIIWKSKKAFVPFISDLSCFTESTAVLKISRYFRRQISYCFQKTWSYFYY